MKQKFFRGFSMKWLLSVSLFSLLLFATNASADLYFNLIYPNSGLIGYPSGDNYAKVTVNLTDPL